MYKKIMKCLLGFMMIVLLIETPLFHNSQNDSINANSGERKSTIDKYDQIMIGGKSYTSLGSSTGR